MTPTRARRTVTAVVAAWLLGLVLVLALWQQVDAACDGQASPTTSASAACLPLEEAAPAPEALPVVTEVAK